LGIRKAIRLRDIKSAAARVFSDERNVILALMIFALTCWLFNVNSPLLDHHSWRQTDTAAIARNFYYNGFNILYPQVDTGGAGPGYVETEFQLVPFIIAIFYKILGVHEYVARLVIIAFSMGSVYLLYKLCRAYFDRNTAIFGTLFFVISPLELFFGRAVMPDSAMIFFSIGSLYFFDKWTRDEEWSSFLLSLICTTLAFLVKIPSLYLGLPLLYLAYTKYGKSLLLEPKLYLFAVLALLPPAAWYYHAHTVLAQYATVGIWDVGSGKWANAQILLNKELYIMLFYRLATVVFTPLGLILFIYGLSLRTKAYLFHIWLLAVLIYFLVVAYGNFAHDYYQRPLVPVGAVFVGRALSAIYEERRTAAWALMALIFISAVYIAAPFYNINTIALEAGAATDMITERSALIITTESETGSNPNLLYYSGRKGWSLPGALWSPERIESLRGEGAGYLLVAPQILLLNNTVFSGYLFKSYRSFIGSNFVIFDLAKPSDIRSLPSLTDLNFQGRGALLGGTIAEIGPTDLLNITCYYKPLNDKYKYYVLIINLLGRDGEVLAKKPFLTSELIKNETFRNNYIALLPERSKEGVYDIQLELHELDERKILKDWERIAY
jgi:hypothetical protein